MLGMSRHWKEDCRVNGDERVLNDAGLSKRRDCSISRVDQAALVMFCHRSGKRRSMEPKE